LALPPHDKNDPLAARRDAGQAASDNDEGGIPPMATPSPPSRPAFTLPAALATATKPGGDAGLREFSFQASDFERVRKLIYQRAGISLSPSKQDMVYSRLARRLRATGCRSFAEYLDGLEKHGGDEWERFVNSLTTNLTSFFREPHHFPIFAEHLQKIGSKRQIRVWCSAASTGEEPYSIAMTVAETFGNNLSHVSIIASDLDTNVLETGRKGVYPADRVEKLSPDRLRRFFTRGTGTQEGYFTVRPELKALISFQRINLLDSSYAVRGPLDVIFCRNVMIYFDKPTQYKILARFAPMLQPDGLMFAGHSESFMHAADLFHSLGKTVYVLARKPR
jgi:chemotaxis protein methyltransferase CheR